MHERIVVSGGSGFIGRLLTGKLVASNYDVIVLTRSPLPAAGAIRQVRWDGRTMGSWTEELEGARALINLAGRSVNCRYNERNRREILESRVDSTRVLGEAIARCNRPPRVWLNASTATIYKHTFDRPMDEASGVIARHRKPRTPSRSRWPAPGNKRSTRLTPRPRARSHCGPRWSSPPVKAACSACFGGSRDMDWEVRWPAETSSCLGSTKTTFAGPSNG